MLAGHAVQHKCVAKVSARTATCLTAGLVALHAPFRRMHVLYTAQLETPGCEPGSSVVFGYVLYTPT